VDLIKMTNLTQFKIRIDNTKSPIRIFRVKKTKDVEVTTTAEHGWLDGAHFQWLLPNGRYWMCQGNDVCGFEIKTGKVIKADADKAADVEVKEEIPEFPEAVTETDDKN
jgi:exopolysaccharide biosynthesis protein